MNHVATINKIALCTDIHFGAKSNSEYHNQDCVNYIKWFCDNVRKDPTIDAIGFLGDWNENRSALNISTLNYSYTGAKMLDDLNMPVFFVVGNHDLYHRHTRKIHSIVPFNEFNNFVIIDQPTVINNSAGDDMLFCPYMFHAEYKDLLQYMNIPVWLGHFEFKGFEVTGNGMKMPTGPDREDFLEPKFILSGHFHKRQAYDGCNIVYIGNTFPTNFGDAGDNNRGMAYYNVNNDELTFDDWLECPKYTKTKLSDLLDNKITLHVDSRVKCIVDIPITFEESTHVREMFVSRYKLREFTLEESYEIKEVLSETDAHIDWGINELACVDDLVLQMLGGIDSKHINNETLVEIYQELKTQI
jgi:DNA repair exonuclease SbcCD nuclease subunit